MKSNGSHKVGVVTASAGTGKTFNLTSRIETEIGSGRDPERVLASTFTVKAAEELRERARGRLIAGGKAEQAVRLLGARIGTINGVCGGLVKEFAFGLGLSPIVDVIDEDVAKSTFRKSSDEAIGRHADELGTLARLFSYEDGFRKPKDWRDDVNKIVELARANNISEAALATCAERSVAGFREMTPTSLPGETEESIDAALLAALEIASRRYLAPEEIAKLSEKQRPAKKTLAVLEDVRDLAAMEVKNVPWQRWAKLAKLDAAVAVADRPNFAQVQAAAAAFARHPRLFDQVSRYTTGVFSCAAEAMRAYAEHKRSWGLVDFVDQDCLALELIGKPEVRNQLKERVESVFVDEFQDTSPLQLAVFVGLSRIAESSVWVGDPKQAIYGFRGTDPDLITYVAQDIRQATGGEDFVLDENWRSRRGLVEFFNDAFGPTFAATGLPEKATRIKKVARADSPGQHTPLAVWNIPGGRANAPRFAAIAAGVVEAVADGSNWAVAEGEETRPLDGGDVAVLCRNNDDCLAMANALAKAGLKVAIERKGLFGTLEGRLAVAALRWCADQNDTVALAELAHLLHDGSEQPAWFDASLVREGRIEALSALVPIAAALRSIGDNGVHKTPLEYLDAVLTRGGVCVAVRRWGRVEDRLLNLEELRKLVATYEDERDRSRAPTTVTDLCAWLGSQDAEQPPSRAPDAVTVLTYHGSKGLEWPLVVLTDLDDEPKGRAFGAHVMSDIPASEIDWNDPLAKRWLRFWPWPMGGQKDNVVLDASAANSPEGKEAARVERAERSRLLYVGATRARDYLVMALPKSTTGWAWLDELKSDTGVPAFVAPKVGDTEVQVNGKPHAVRVADPVPVDETASADMAIAFAGDEVKPITFPPLALKPSGEGSQEDARIVEEIDLGARLPFSGSPDMNSVGEALHRFLAADDPTRDDGRRNALAKRLLDAWGVTGLDPRDVVTMGTRFRVYIDKRWPGAVLRRETPIVHRMGNRTLSGRLDLVVETSDAIIVVDHKSFPGGRPQWLEQARKHAGQLRLYGEAISATWATPKPVQLALHLPISGELLIIQ
jgi:ATP-dependent exoDNAse (exonuclease V) beta subunit